MTDDARSEAARVLAVVPAFNESGSLPGLVAELRGLPEAPDVLVIDDGSADDSAEIAARAGARVIRLPYNCGIGVAVQTGIVWGRDRGYDLVVRFDGDGQHDPGVLASLKEKVLSGDADFVVGSRYLAKEGFQSTWARRFGSRWFSLLLGIVAGISMTDPTSGLWLGNRRALEVLAVEYASDYPEVDSLVRLHRAGCRLAESPVRMRARVFGRSSIDLARSVYYMLKVTVALLVGRVERPVSTGEGP
jgi:glycosyltransferase involved in cell wall biosynthesis